MAGHGAVFAVLLFLSVLNSSQLPHDSCDWKSCDRHFYGKMATYNRQNMPSESRQNQWSNGFSSRGTPSNTPDLRFILPPMG